MNLQKHSGTAVQRYFQSATSGYHYHLIEASSEERLDLIEKQLGEAGFLAPLQPWEQTTGKGKIKL